MRQTHSANTLGYKLDFIAMKLMCCETHIINAVMKTVFAVSILKRLNYRGILLYLLATVNATNAMFIRKLFVLHCY